ncbi:unnamed protein product [Adineta steineri]|uniref:Uncharacterized protein n=1 Tax=Adineta steineri TaxID=433720 RepID=A0A815JUP5_9BILA|nr:unnamed protein product [Adineta steineri]CAF3626090.1 unnamed protein product [Adineta steineri]
MSIKTSVRKLPPHSSLHIPLSHRRFQNRAAAVYDMSIDCHDIETICHIHRLSESIIIQDWKGNFDYLKSKLNFNDRKDIKKRFLTIMKEIEHDHIQPTLAAIVHHIPFIYIEQAIAEQDITNAYNRFLDDFDSKRLEPKDENIIQKHLNNGQPVLTSFEQYLLLEHLIDSISTNKYRRLILLEKCLLQYIQLIIKTNYPLLTNISYLDKIWLKNFLLSFSPQMKSIDISWLNMDQL